MKVLITGGAGFIGGHLAQYLAKKNYKVLIVDNLARGLIDNFLQNILKNSNISFIRGDITDSDFINSLGNDFDFIYHLAAIIGVSHVLNRPYDVLALNFKMTENIINLGKNQKHLKRLIFSSTSEVYAGTLLYGDMPIPTPETTPITLTDLKQPRTSYMLSKLYGEAMCNLSGLPTTVVRFHNVYGPRMGMSHVIPELMKKIWLSGDGEIVKVFSANHSRTFCYIDDAIYMLYSLAESEKSNNQTVNIGNEGPEIKIGDLAKMIVKVVARRVTLTSGEVTPGSPSRRCPSIGVLQEMIEYNKAIDIGDGLELTYDWYLKNIFLGGEMSAK